MKTNKFVLALASVALLVIAVGVLVWPTPKEAKASDSFLEFEVIWQNPLMIRYNVQPVFELLHDGLSYDPPITEQLVDAGDHIDYLGSFSNPPSNADEVRLTWIVGPYEWGNWAPGETATFNWSGVTWAETHGTIP